MRACVVLLVCVVACKDTRIRPCVDDNECNLLVGATGACHPSPASATGWCAYEDSECASGERWSQFAGDDLALTCRDPDPAVDAGVPDATPLLALTVTKVGTGAGTVTSEPDGIDCGTVCEMGFVEGASVTLEAVPDPGDIFRGWSGDCEGLGPCVVPMTEPRDVTAHFAAPPGELLWLKRFGGEMGDNVTAAANTPTGDVIVAGVFRSTVDFGDGFAATSEGDADVFIAKLRGTDGTILWLKTLGGPLQEFAELDVAVTSAGDAVVVGAFNSLGVSLDDLTLTNHGDSDGFVVKLSGLHGTPLWGAPIGGTGDDRARGVTVDSVGNVYVTGWFNSTSFTLAAETLTNAGAAGTGDVFVGKFAGASGVETWARAFTGTGNDRGMRVAVDSDDNVIVSGTFRYTLSFGGGNSETNSTGAIFLTKFTGTESHVWDTQLSGPWTVGDMAVDAGDGIYLSGVTYAGFSFAGDSFAAPAFDAIYIARFTSDGAPSVAEVFEATTQDETLNGLEVVGDRIWAAGDFGGSINLGGGVMTSAGGGTGAFDAVLGRFTTSLAYEYSANHGSPTNEFTNALAANADRVVLCGRFTGVAPFYDEAIMTAGLDDGFCVAIAP